MLPSTFGSSTPQTDYTLEFVGTWPSPLSQVLNTQTQWRLRDPQNREWLFQTLLNPDTGDYDLARPISLTFMGGMEWTFSYGSLGELTSITDSFGKVISFTWIIVDPGSVGSPDPDYAAAISEATLPDGNKIEYVYEAINASASSLPQPDRLVEVRHKDASNNLLNLTKYVYENSNLPRHVTGILDANDVRRWTVAYDARGRVVTSAGPDDADKQAITYTIAGSGSSTIFRRTVTNALGKAATYDFRFGGSSSLNNLRLTAVNGVASANCPASTVTYTYASSLGFMATETDEEGRVTSYTRDARGLPTAITRGHGTPGAVTTNYSWHSTLRVPTQIVEPGLTTDFTWNSLGQLTQVTQTDTTSHSVPYPTNGQIRTWAFTYTTTGGLLETVDGPLGGTGDTVTYAYNSSGYLQSVTNEVGHVTEFTAWNGRGQPTSMTDPNGVVSTFTYDLLGRLTAITVDPGGVAATTTFDYNVVNDVTKITRPNGAFLEYTWDDARRVTKIEDNTGASVAFVRDELGNVTERTIEDSGSNVLLAHTATFDELGRLLTFVGAASQTWAHGYDKTSNLKSVTDPRSNLYQWTFDSLNRLFRETDEVSAQVNLTLNGKDEVTAYSDPRTLVTSYVRNGFGDAIQRTSPDSGTTVYEYNALGKPTKITDGRSVVTDLTYDAAGRLLTREYPAATVENVTQTWDSTAGGNKGKGRITKIEDQSGSVEWVYDALGRAAQEKKSTGSAVYTLDYTYDADGNVTEIVYPSGRIVAYDRDALGRIAGVTTKENASSSVVALASDVTYRPFGAVTGFTYGNGLTLTKGFDLDYRPAAILVEDGASSTAVVDREMSYADGINLTGIADNLDPGRSETYAYTPANRLQQAAGIWGTLDYAYDLVGNRTSEALTSGTTTTWSYAYPSGSNRLGTVTEGLDVRTLTHDGAGNVSADDRVGTVYNYAHNNRGRLSGLSIGATATASYVYDGLERLAVRTTQNITPAGTTHYLYDLNGRLLVEADNTGQTLREYVWLDDLPLAVVADVDTVAPKLWFVHADHLNRPIKMTDVMKAVVWDAAYKPFGDVHSITGSASNNLRFPGQYFQLEAGLHYNWHRHYDPTLGRYLQPDPISDHEQTSGLRSSGTFMPLTPSNALAHVSTSQLGGAVPASFRDGPSIYAYAKANPTQYVDIEGKAVLAPLVPLAVVGRYCLQYPALCAATVRAGVNACFRTISGFGGGGGGSDPDCKEEWDSARARCQAELAKPSPNRHKTGGHRNIEDCARGYVSERCGGNSLDWGRSSRRR